MHILTNIHKMCIVKVKASTSKLSENGRTLANILVADQNILLYKPQYILSQYQHYPSASQSAAAASTNISHR